MPYNSPQSNPSDGSSSISNLSSNASVFSSYTTDTTSTGSTLVSDGSDTNTIGEAMASAPNDAMPDPSNTQEPAHPNALSSYSQSYDVGQMGSWQSSPPEYSATDLSAFDSAVPDVGSGHSNPSPIIPWQFRYTEYTDISGHDHNQYGHAGNHSDGSVHSSGFGSAEGGSLVSQSKVTPLADANGLVRGTAGGRGEDDKDN